MLAAAARRLAPSSNNQHIASLRGNQSSRASLSFRNARKTASRDNAAKLRYKGCKANILIAGARRFRTVEFTGITITGMAAITPWRWACCNRVRIAASRWGCGPDESSDSTYQTRHQSLAHDLKEDHRPFCRPFAGRVSSRSATLWLQPCHCRRPGSHPRQKRFAQAMPSGCLERQSPS